MRNILPDNQIRAMATAMAGAVVAAVATMFVPAAVLEGLIGSTGLSEMFVAAKPPLGDTARAVIAFGAGALPLAVLAYALMRQERPVAADVGEDSDDEAPSPLRHLLTKIEIPKMPWVKGEDDITELSDLPKLKNGDIHPDAPPRRPLSAHQDLPVLHSTEVEALVAEDIVSEPVVERAEPPRIESAENAEPKAAAAAPAMVMKELQPTLAEMVAQLEAAVAERQKQLAELEVVAAQLSAGPAEIHEPTPEPPRTQRLPIATVPARIREDEMDSTLSAALATLHRMNATER